jgi:ParB family chromosome partitioning protein
MPVLKLIIRTKPEATMSQMKPTNTLKPDPKQPRKFFSDEELDRLGDDMLARGVLVPLLILPDGTVIDGERRKLAAVKKGIKELPVRVIDKPMSEKELRGIQLATVFHKVDLTAYEKYETCAELMCMNPGWMAKDCAEFLHLDPSMLTRLLSPCRCVPAVQEALKQGKIGISDCYAISKLSEPEQAGLLALKLSGASRDQLEVAGRKSRNAGQPTVRVQRVKCILPNGVSVVVAGEGVSLDESIEALGEVMKEMKRARDLGYTAKTFAAAMKDRSKRG